MNDSLWNATIACAGVPSQFATLMTAEAGATGITSGGVKDGPKGSRVEIAVAALSRSAGQKGVT